MSQRVVVFEFKEEKAQAKARESMGLKEIKSGWKFCLRCDKKFWSVDVCSNRMCARCIEKSNGYNGETTKIWR